MTFSQCDKNNKSPAEPQMPMKKSQDRAEQPGESWEAGQPRPQCDPRTKAIESKRGSRRRARGPALKESWVEEPSGTDGPAKVYPQKCLLVPS